MEEGRDGGSDIRKRTNLALGLNPWAAAVGIAGIAASLLRPAEKPTVWTFVIAGDTAGYLSPCGCTSPMSGGIKRWATAVRSLSSAHQVVLYNGDFVAGTGAQDLMKAEALAESLTSVNVAAINLGSSDVALGPGEVSQLSQLTGGKFVSTAVGAISELEVKPYSKTGPFLIGGAVSFPSSLKPLGRKALTPEESAEQLLKAARGSRLVPVLLLDGDRKLAHSIALAIPGIKLIVYREQGDLPNGLEREGNTILITPGQRGKYLVRLIYAGGAFQPLAPIDLGPTVKDDPKVARIYDAYLRRVDSSNLIDSWPRSPTEPFAGSARCGACHSGAYSAWKSSKHSGSYLDLKSTGHGRDPDCVVCHVTGLSSNIGFLNASTTPELSFVGCESCHGAGERHSLSPNAVRMPKVDKTSCLPCHDSENSPRFNFLTYWAKIRHS